MNEEHQHHFVTDGGPCDGCGKTMAEILSPGPDLRAIDTAVAIAHEISDKLAFYGRNSGPCGTVIAIAERVIDKLLSQSQPVGMKGAKVLSEYDRAILEGKVPESCVACDGKGGRDNGMCYDPCPFCEGRGSTILNDTIQRVASQSHSEAQICSLCRKPFNDTCRQGKCEIPQPATAGATEIAREVAKALKFPNEQCRSCFCESCEDARADIITAALTRHSAALRERTSKIERQLEREQMCHAACSVIAMSNTPESLAKTREMHPDYLSASVHDCIQAMERELALREQLIALGRDSESAITGMPAELVDVEKAVLAIQAEQKLGRSRNNECNALRERVALTKQETIWPSIDFETYAKERSLGTEAYRIAKDAWVAALLSKLA